LVEVASTGAGPDDVDEDEEAAVGVEEEEAAAADVEEEDEAAGAAAAVLEEDNPTGPLGHWITGLNVTPGGGIPLSGMVEVNGPPIG
jgi:hypothetical protein